MAKDYGDGQKSGIPAPLVKMMLYVFTMIVWNPVLVDEVSWKRVAAPVTLPGF
jgi:hypothetical protein